MNCENVGLGGLASQSIIFKRKFRWMFRNFFIDSPGEGLSVLAPLKGARPTLEFKEIEVQHVVEDVMIPGKPSWRPINLTLYETCPPTDHPIWNWILRCYDSQRGEWFPFVDNQFKITSCLELYTGGGDVIENWIFENSWPQQINFGELDMGSSEVVTCDITLRYDRAHWHKCCCGTGGDNILTKRGGDNILSQF